MLKFKIIVFFLSGITCSALSQPDSTAQITLQTFEMSFRVVPFVVYKTEQIEDSTLLRQGTINLIDALGRTAPVFIKTYGSNGISLLNLRGGKPGHTKIFWNGVDLTYPSLGESDLSLIPFSAVSEIGINYGPGSASAAAGGMGGTVQLGQTNSNDSTLIRVGGQISSLMNVDARFKVEQIVGKGRLSFFGEYTEGKNQFEFTNPTLPDWPKDTLLHANFKQASGGLNYTRVSGHFKINTGGWYRTGNRNVPPLNTQSTYYGEKYHDEIGVYALELATLTGKLGIKFNSGVVWALNGYDNPQVNVYASNETFSWQNQFSLSQLSDQKIWNFKWKAQIRQVLNRAGSRSYHTDETAQAYSVFGSAEITPLKAIRTVFTMRSEYQFSQFSGLLPGFVVSYRPQRAVGFNTHISWTRNIKYPTLNQLYWQPGGNPDLLAEEGSMSELSIGYGVVIGKWFFKLQTGIYYGSFLNWIAWTPGQSYWSPHNIKSVVTKGVESALRFGYEIAGWSFTSKLKVNLNRSINQSTNDFTEITGNDVIYAPRFQATSLLTIKKGNWELSWFQPVTGKYYLSTDNQSFMPGFSYANVNIGRDLRNNFSNWYVMCGVDNITNWQYQVVPNRPMPGRQFKIGLQYQFKK